MATHDLPADPTGRLGDLADALGDRRLDLVAADGSGPAGAVRAALRLATTLGYCRLYALSPGDRDGTLQAHLAVAAAGRLADHLGRLAEQAERLGADWDAEPDPAAADERVAALLQGRMDALAALEALHEAATDADATATAAINAVAGPLDRFDAALESHADILATLVGSPLMGEWEGRLAGRFRDPLPWWVGPDLVRVANRRAEPARPAEPPVLPAVAFAAELAADPVGTVGGSARRYQWVSPRGGYRLVLWLPSDLEPRRDQTLTANLFRADGSAATDLAGAPVRVGPAALAVDAAGRVRVRLSAVAGRPLRVVVGEPGVEWAYQVEEQ